MREFTLHRRRASSPPRSTAGIASLTRHADRKPDGTDPADTRVSVSGEAVGLAALFLCGSLLTIALSSEREYAGTDRPRERRAPSAGDADSPATAPETPRASKTFKVPDAQSGDVRADRSTPDRIVFGAMRDDRVRKPRGSVSSPSTGHTGQVNCGRFEATTTTSCRSSARPRSRTAGCSLRRGAARPTTNCRFFCPRRRRPASPPGRKPITTTSHTEGNPRVVKGGKVILHRRRRRADLRRRGHRQPAKWAVRRQAAQGLHIDGPPAVSGQPGVRRQRAVHARALGRRCRDRQGSVADPGGVAVVRRPARGRHPRGVRPGHREHVGGHVQVRRGEGHAGRVGAGRRRRVRRGRHRQGGVAVRPPAVGPHVARGGCVLRVRHRPRRGRPLPRPQDRQAPLADGHRGRRVRRGRRWRRPAVTRSRCTPFPPKG